jgi:hypothetical protein
VPPAHPPVVTVTPRDDLQALLDTLRGPATVQLAPGDYHLTPVAFTDSTCGNCQDADDDVSATRGLLVRGDSITLAGETAGHVVLHTHAGYGVLFDGCDGCALERVTVTDGVRDPDGRATDAGVVIRAGRVRLSDCVVRDNLGDSATVHSGVVGIMGIAVREGGDATVSGCRVERNSWDGITGYRDARILAEDNVVDGVDAARGAQMGGGRGVGIGLTWNAEGVVRGNLVTRYWKGIGVFVDARASITGNVVEDVLTWGLAYWGPDGGRPVAWIERNAVFETGACGVILDRATPWAPASGPSARSPGMDALRDDGPGDLVGNAFARTGQDARYDSGEPYCTQRPIARHAVPEGFAIADNLVWDVRQPGDAPREDTLDAATFRAGVAPLVEQLAAWPAVAGSRFVGAFGSVR